MHQAIALEIIDALYIRRNICFTGMASGLDDVPWANDAYKVISSPGGLRRMGKHYEWSSCRHSHTLVS